MRALKATWMLATALAAATAVARVEPARAEAPAPPAAPSAPATRSAPTPGPAAAPARAKSRPAAHATLRKGASASRAVADSSGDMTLKGGEEGTVFRTLTVQGEDRIHIEVERPALQLDMDPESAPGLDRGTARDVLDRTTPDFEAPLLAVSSRQTSPWVGRPWLSHFPEGAVARFRPAVTGVERWKLVVVNARAESVAVFRGNGDPPREIAWDGRSTTGSPVLPGTSYSYVFEARDRAGNRRNFVGEGFSVNSFRYSTPKGPVLVFSGRGLDRPAGGTGGAPGSGAAGSDSPPPLVLEVATALNQVPADRPVRIEVTARSYDEANTFGQRLVRWMSPWVVGDPARLRLVAQVQSDAPAAAAVKVSTAD